MVKIYAANVRNLPDPGKQPELMDGLPEKRKEKILRYRQEKDRRQSLGASLLLKKCLEERNINMEKIQCGENGKPEVEGLHFNLSHSHDMAVCAVSDKGIGCDIEMIGDLRTGIAERFFTKNEVRYLNGFDGDSQREEFYRLWTMKESYLKMTGEGMSLSLDRFEFSFGEDVQVYRDGELCQCFVREYEVPGYKLTVCAKEAEFEEIISYVEFSGI